MVNIKKIDKPEYAKIVLFIAKNDKCSFKDISQDAAGKEIDALRIKLSYLQKHLNLIKSNMKSIGRGRGSKTSYSLDITGFLEFTCKHILPNGESMVKKDIGIIEKKKIKVYAHAFEHLENMIITWFLYINEQKDLDPTKLTLRQIAEDFVMYIGRQHDLVIARKEKPSKLPLYFETACYQFFLRRNNSSIMIIQDFY